MALEIFAHAIQRFNLRGSDQSLSGQGGLSDAIAHMFSIVHAVLLPVRQVLRAGPARALRG